MCRFLSGIIAGIIIGTLVTHAGWVKSIERVSSLVEVIADKF